MVAASAAVLPPVRLLPVVVRLRCPGSRVALVGVVVRPQPLAPRVTRHPHVEPQPPSLLEAGRRVLVAVLHRVARLLLNLVLRLLLPVAVPLLQQSLVGPRQPPIEGTVGPLGVVVGRLSPGVPLGPLQRAAKHPSRPVVQRVVLCLRLLHPAVRLPSVGGVGRVPRPPTAAVALLVLRVPLKGHR